jgi:hypothetical protein
VGANDRAAKSVASPTAYHASMAERTLRRQTSKVGARCGNTARRDLCGGGALTRVSTAILHEEGGEETDYAENKKPFPSRRTKTEAE